jgi:hypothetical protein
MPALAELRALQGPERDAAGVTRSGETVPFQRDVLEAAYGLALALRGARTGPELVRALVNYQANVSAAWRRQLALAHAGQVEPNRCEECHGEGFVESEEGDCAACCQPILVTCPACNGRRARADAVGAHRGHRP